MPNLKSIKVRIKTVKNTQKITQAMKLVAASKVRKAQIRVLNSRPYSQKVTGFVTRTVSAMSLLERNETPLMNQRDIKSVGLIVISSDRGLCGSYNTNVIKRTIKRIIELQGSGLHPKLIIVGSKANNFFRRTKTESIGCFTQLPAIPNVELANLIASSAERAFLNKEIDKVEIIGTDFVSMLRNQVYVKQFLPIVSNNTQNVILSEAKDLITKGDSSPSAQNDKTHSSFVLFEPSLNIVLDNLLPLYLSNVLFHALLEAVTSELASRMNAMSNATKNAKEIIDNLTLVYNKARQAAITQELTEIVGGVEALK